MVISVAGFTESASDSRWAAVIHRDKTVDDQFVYAVKPLEYIAAHQVEAEHIECCADNVAAELADYGSCKRC